MTAPRPAGYRLALIHGNSLPEGADPVEGKRMKIDARGALPVEAIDAGEIVSLPRHGFDRSVPAHLVDHRANIRALCELGCNRVLALGSAGSLDKDLHVRRSARSTTSPTGSPASALRWTSTTGDATGRRGP